MHDKERHSLMRILTVLLLAFLLWSPVLPAWAARGFGSTDGTTTTDVVTTGLTSETTQTSISVWVWRTGAGGSNFGRILGKGSDAFGWRWFHDDAGANGQIIIPWTGEGNWTFPRPTDAAWHHYLITYDAGATTNNPIVYIDGASVTVTVAAAPTGSRVTNAAPWLTGNRTDAARVLNGRVAELAIFQNVILTSGNATTLYNGGAGARADSLATQPTVYWKLCGTASPEPNEVVGSSGTVTVTDAPFRQLQCPRESA